MCVCICVVCQHFQTSPLKPPWGGGTKICSNGQGHMTKMAAIPIYGKNLKNLLLWNQKADDLETWYAPSGARVLPSLFKWWPWLTMTNFTARSNLVPYAFIWEKGKTMEFSETVVVYDLKLATDDRSARSFLLTSKRCPWGLYAPCPGDICMY